MGRGVFCDYLYIENGSIIETSPVLLVLATETGLDSYIFEWTTKYNALALGFGSLFNHSTSPNVDYKLCKKDKTIKFYANKGISEGEQLFINYGYEPKEYL